MPEYHPVVNKIRSLLDQHNCWYETFEHESVRTSAEGAAVRSGYVQHQGAKALIAKIYRTGQPDIFVMLVFPGDEKFDKNKVLDVLQGKNIRFATEAEVGQITGGVVPGGVPPFGNLFGLPVYVDRALFGNEKIIFNAGDRRFSIGMFSADYKKLVNPIEADFIIS